MSQVLSFSSALKLNTQKQKKSKQQNNEKESLEQNILRNHIKLKKQQKERLQQNKDVLKSYSLRT